MWESVVLVLCVSIVQGAKESKEASMNATEPTKNFTEPSMNAWLLQNRTSFRFPNTNLKFLQVQFNNLCNLAQPLCVCYNSSNAIFTPQMIDPSICGGRHGYLCAATFADTSMVLSDYVGSIAGWTKTAIMPLEGGLMSIKNVPFYVPRFVFLPEQQMWEFDIWKGEGCEKGSVIYSFLETRNLREV